MNNNAEDQDIKVLLQEAYQTPSPDPAFVRVLGERLKQELADSANENMRLAERPAKGVVHLAPNGARSATDPREEIPRVLARCLHIRAHAGAVGTRPR